MTTYWMVWDGAGHWIADELIRRGYLPALAALQKRGVMTAARTSAPSCQTPAGLACLFTGTPPAVNGVNGFWVPGAIDGDLTSQRPGFDPGVCREPAVWQRLGDDGFRSVMIHAPWTFEPDDSVPPPVLGAVEAYSRRVARERHQDFAPDARVTWDDLGEPVTVQRCGGTAEVVLTGPGGDRLTLGERWTAFGSGARAWYRTVLVGSRVTCVRTGSWKPRVAGSAPATVAALRTQAAEFPFVGESTGALYRAGVYGPRLADGGDGSAERVLLSAAALVADSFRGSTTAALATVDDPDLVVVYLPITDDLGHELVGLLAPETGTPAETAAAAWDVVGRGYRLADQLLADLLDRAGDRDSVLVTADHGMTAVTTTLYPNNLLVAANLAMPGADGADPHRSRVFYHAANNGMLVRGQGSPADLAAAVALLREHRHPGTGEPAVGPPVDAHGDELIGPLPDDVVQLVFGAGVLPCPDVTGGETFGPPLRSAAHTTNNGDPGLDAVFAAAGPTVRAGDGARLRSNREVAAFVERSVRAARHATEARRRGQLRLCVVGRSGAGKSTFFDIAKQYAAERGLDIVRVKLAEPLYRLQQQVRAAAGVDLPEKRQDQLLMESLAQHLRRLNPRALVAPLVAGLPGRSADLVINDDLRDPFVDLPELLAHGFQVIRIHASDETRARRLGSRGDVSVSDASTVDLDLIPALWTVENEQSLTDFHDRVVALLEVLVLVNHDGSSKLSGVR